MRLAATLPAGHDGALVLLGSSMGGLVAMTWALRAPELLQCLDELPRPMP